MGNTTLSDIAFVCHMAIDPRMSECDVPEAVHPEAEKLARSILQIIRDRPRWRNEDVEEFLDDRSQRYELALRTLEGTVVELRNRVRELEAENSGLRYDLDSPPILAGYHMEGADID